MKKLFTNIALVMMLLAAFPIAPAQAASAYDSSFNPGMLITDEAFADVGTFGSAGGIQNFLEQHDSKLANTSPSFLVQLKEPDSTIKSGLEDPQPNLGRLRSAAELIYDAATSHGLNPQVILVILEKEQSLITGNFSGDTLQHRMDRALGFGCPDYEGCGDIFMGFYRQLFGTFDSEGNRWLGAAASLMRSFVTEVNGVRVGRGPMIDANNQVFGRPVVRTARKGDTVVIDNTLGGYKGVEAKQSVTFQNFATAALYRYTPHVFNGNYNFWHLYYTWFKYPNGTVIKLSKDKSEQTYVIDNGTKRPFSPLVAQQRKIKTDKVVTLSQSEFDSYITEKQMPPVDGTLIKGDTSAAVWLIEDTKKHAISGPVFAQRKYSFANVVTIPQAEVDTYDTGSYVTPTDGTLIVGETDGTVYLVDNGLKRPVTYEIFMARKMSFKNLMKLSDAEVKGIPSGQFVYPPDSVAIQLKGSTGIYWFKDNQKKYVSAFVYKQRGVANFPVVQLGQLEFDSIPTGAPFPPKDGAIIQGDQTTAIYIIENGVKRLLTPASYKRLKNPKPVKVPQAEVDAFASGAVLEK